MFEHVVERKRSDDLATSIIDGRYQEQQFRFNHARIRHPVYLVENHSKAELSALRATSLLCAYLFPQPTACTCRPAASSRASSTRR